MRLAEKVAVITGCATGQGRAAARLFASEGAQLALADWNADGGAAIADELAGQGFEVLFDHVDVQDSVAVDRFRDRTLDRYGRVDVLYNNAGVSFSGPYRVGTVIDTPEGDWDAVISVNLKSVYLMMRAFLPGMIDRHSGSIVNTSSTNALVGMVNNDAYTASKAGVLALTRSTAVRFGKYGVRANVLVPGPVETPMISALLERPGAREATEAMTALRRIGRPEEIAAAALFLASDESSFMTGSVLVVDGGQTAI